MRNTQIPTERETERLLALAEEDLETAALFWLLWGAGLTVAEATGLRWEQTRLRAGRLEMEERIAPLPPEAAEALEALPRRGEWVFPSDRNPGEPISRMTATRWIRELLDRAGLERLQPRDLQYLSILRLMETGTLEEAARATGWEVRSLQALWKKFGRGEPPHSTSSSGNRAPDCEALRKALSREGGSPGARIARLVWQGGLYLRQIRTLRWEDLSPDCRSWTLDGTAEPVPPGLRPVLRKWRERDDGTGFVVAGPRSGTPGDIGSMDRRVQEYFTRHGLEGTSLTHLRGLGTERPEERERLLTLARSRVRFRLRTARLYLGLTGGQTARLLEELEQDGVLEREPGEDGEIFWRLAGGQTPRELFDAALAEARGRALGLEELRTRTGLSRGLLHYYIREALETGRLRRTGHGHYRAAD